MTVVVASLVKNEANRMLSQALAAWQDFADEILILDDSSEDESIEICHEAGAIVHARASEQAAWGNESSARASLLRLAVQVACDWIFVLDADMIPLCNPRRLFNSSAEAVSFRLYDLWTTNPCQYRNDGFWHAHRVPRVWAVRTDSLPADPSWSGRGIHSGHLPTNYQTQRIITAPQDYSLLHYAYSREDWRVEKHARYLSLATDLGEFEREHAESIIDPEPNLEPLPWEPEWPIVF